MDAPTEHISCGPFEVVEPVGSGGMGAVYRGRHREDGTDVAIKVMTLDEATDPSYLRAFRREAQALAKLHHPSIADVFDYGTVSEETASRGPLPFREGAPWFAMEYVEGTSVGKIAGVWTWSELEKFLLSVLDALAHAHARGVLHRDLTASNILVESEGGPGSIQVVDFGLARLLESIEGHGGSADGGPVRGTPRYMAPEQILGEWRNQGPWTDLYALGCLAWRIACGESPFQGESTKETFRAHFEGIQGSFNPRFSVPEAFEPRVRGLVDRRPESRCRRAADAAWALLEMEPPGG